jgi:hypothetical protein
MAIQSHANSGQDRPARWTLGRDKLAIRAWWGTDPSILVGISIGLIIIGLVFALNLTEFDSLAAVAAFLKLPIWQRLAWLVVALSSLCVIAENYLAEPSARRPSQNNGHIGETLSKLA